jgi:diaminopimelate epimerase
MELEIVRADPAGNITIFVLSPLVDREARTLATRALLAEADLKAEQVGFVLPPATGREYWRLEMMGGEFCGNAARSFGLFAAAQTGFSGTLLIEISGQAGPLAVHVDIAAGTAEVEMPGPLAETTVEYKGRRFPVYVFEGITHVIAKDIAPDEALLRPLTACFGENPPPALGVMFYDSRNRFMRPLVWVRAAETTVFESSCGSGSAALGLWLLKDIQDADECFEIIQPGGTIETCVLKKSGVIQRLSIGGTVTLSGSRRRLISC